SPEAVESGTEAIKNRYIEEGFWDIKVTERTLQSTTTDRHQVQIVVSIEEGQRRLFDRVELFGTKELSSDDLEDLWKTGHGEPFDRAEILTFQQKVRSEYASRGYFYTTVSVELITEGRNSQEIFVTAKTTVDEGPRIRFGDIFISGLVKTDPQVV